MCVRAIPKENRQAAARCQPTTTKKQNAFDVPIGYTGNATSEESRSAELYSITLNAPEQTRADPHDDDDEPVGGGDRRRSIAQIVRAAGLRDHRAERDVGNERAAFLAAPAPQLSARDRLPAQLRARAVDLLHVAVADVLRGVQARVVALARAALLADARVAANGEKVGHLKEKYQGDAQSHVDVDKYACAGEAEKKKHAGRG